MIEPGNLRHRVSLQQRTLEQDSNGDPITAWVEVVKLWASITPLSVREFINAQAQQSEVDARIAIYYRSNVNAQMRIVHRERVYDIKGVLPDPDSGIEYLTLACKTGQVELEPDES